MKLSKKNKFYHIIEDYQVYRTWGVPSLNAAVSAVLKMPVHSLIFRYQHYLRRYLKNKNFDYEDGIWLTFHFGLNQYRPLIINRKCIYLRGEAVTYVEPFTTDNVEYLHISSQTNFLSIINTIKNYSIICASIDGKIGSYDKNFYIGKCEVYYNSTMISASQLLRKKVFFELYYLDHLLRIQRKVCELTTSNFGEEIQKTFSEVLLKYPHNARFKRFKNG